MGSWQFLRNANEFELANLNDWQPILKPFEIMDLGNFFEMPTNIRIRTCQKLASSNDWQQRFCWQNFSSKNITKKYGKRARFGSIGTLAEVRIANIYWHTSAENLQFGSHWHCQFQLAFPTSLCY